MAGIVKTFGATRALRGCSLEVHGGEVHALLGENGSGKSTLVKILSGVHRPDAGTISVGERERVHLPAPRAAIAAGISTVYQEILVARQQSVLTNVWLGSDRLLRRRQTLEERRRRAADLLGQLIVEPRLDVAAGDLSLSDRQAVCIARALAAEPRLLLLDEATSALDLATRDRLFAIISRLREQGVGILFISHRLDEIEAIADRVTVMRSGEKVATGERGQFAAHQLVSLMTGGDHAAQRDSSTTRARGSRDARVVARAVDVRIGDAGSPIDLEIRAGDFIGLAGLEGHGQERFLQILGGSPPASGRVLCTDGTSELALRSPGEAQRARIAYMPRDRREESIFPTRSILDNFASATVDEDARRGLLSQRATASRFARYRALLQITTGRYRDPITSLSGGNQQKVVLARWLATKPRLLLLNDPTRGVDPGAKRDIHRILIDAAADGVAIVMISSELIDFVDLMDRVLVFRESELFCSLAAEQLTAERLVASYFGHADV